MSNIKKNLLFPENGDSNLYDKLQIDYESVKYITIPDQANKITKIIDDHCKKLNLNINNLIITDATSGVGGNVISFCKYFRHVNAIEIDHNRYRFLVNNIKEYNYNNINMYCDDCLNLIFNIDSDIIFIDPPWGGDQYINENNITLKINNINIENICNNLFIQKNIKMIVLKLPRNYNIDNIYNVITNKKVYIHNVNKILIILIY